MFKRIALAKHRKKAEFGLESLSENLKKNIYARSGQISQTEPELINSGSRGSVYLLEDGRVLKITSDQSEAFAASIVKNNPNKDIYTVYDVFELDSEPQMFGIVQEKLKSPEKEWVKFGDIFNEWHSYMTDYIEDVYPDYEYQLYLLPPTIVLFNKFLDSKYGGESFEKQREWLQRVTDYLVKNNILYLDIHGGNIMKNHQTEEHVLIDIGYSVVPKQKLDKITDSTGSKIIAKKLIILSKLLSKYE